MNLLYPKITWPHLWITLKYAMLGALVAGAYGIVHDQITFTISPEYFTRMKFNQFYYTDFGLPLRLRVAMIGFLATWWVGFIGVWFLSRMAVPAFPPAQARKEILRGVLTMVGLAIVGGGIGLVVGRLGSPFSPRCDMFTGALGVKDPDALVRVAYIHNGSYLGGLVGLVAALIVMARRRREKPHVNEPLAKISEDISD
jgi:hypothetical protein